MATLDPMLVEQAAPLGFFETNGCRQNPWLANQQASRCDGPHHQHVRSM
jgi:hypothetical protein